MLLPKVSILIPCYNAERWVAQAIQSALDQTYPNKEVIVVDDGSSDCSLEVIKSFSDRIRWETQLNHGGNAARNRLLELSTGDWIQYLDADDYLQPDKIEQQIQALQNTPQADVIYSPSIFEYSDQQPAQQKILPIPEPHDPWVLLARWYLPQTGSPLWRRQAIINVGGWKLNQPCCQEHELYSRLLMAGKQFVYFAEAGSIYRQWSEATVCKRNKPEVFRRRLEIEATIEQFLRQSGQLTPARLTAINQGRFECARLIWLFDQTWARQIMAQIQASDPQFIPSGSAAPAFYQLTYRWFGFTGAEQIAAAKRNAFRLLRHPFTTATPVHS
jgi:Glycosyl transferase family 2